MPPWQTTRILYCRRAHRDDQIDAAVTVEVAGRQRLTPAEDRIRHDRLERAVAVAQQDRGARSREPGRTPDDACAAVAIGFCHWTLALTEALAFSVNVQLRVLFPPLEDAPDQTTSRPLVALSVILVPTVNDADPVLPTATLMPAGLDVTRSPLRPVAVTVSVAS